MKTKSFASLLGALAIHGLAYADVTFNVHTYIPDGNAVGLPAPGKVSGLSGVISSISLGINLTGGYNGDLFAYLEAPNGATVALFNQPGVTENDPFGFGGSGLAITLSAAGTSKFQTANETPGLVVTGDFQPTGSFATLNDLDPNGTWTLFVADLADGGGLAELNTWSLNIGTVPAAVPEPGQGTGMALLAVAALGVRIYRSRFLP